MSNFEALGLSPLILKSIARLGFDKPTPIQQKAIPLVMEGRDIMGLAQTGTGKTAAFGLPLVEHLFANKSRPQPKTAKSLILAPTRELANQIADNLRLYVQGTSLRVNVVVGGASINVQRKKLEQGTDILVATPGRLMDLLDRGALRLNETNFLVLDEADQMLDLGFINALRKIAKLLAPKRQTLLFSATMPKQMAELSKSYLNDPVRIETASVGKAADKVTQCVHYIDGGKKADFLEECLSKNPEELSIVFARTKHGAEKLMKRLVAKGFDAASIHGNKSQGQRDRAIRDFRAGNIKILVATDVAARGIDIPGVAFVYNFDLPEVPENYVHRIGRTARAGAEGQAIAFCSPGDAHLLFAIEEVMKINIHAASGQRPTKAEARANKTPTRGGRAGGKAHGNRNRDAKRAGGQRNTAGAGTPSGKRTNGSKPSSKSGARNGNPKNRFRKGRRSAASV
ncbi:MAG: DEAD/DEAH box helicase [Hyphomicrobiales bacterium]